MCIDKYLSIYWLLKVESTAFYYLMNLLMWFWVISNILIVCLFCASLLTTIEIKMLRTLQHRNTEHFLCIVLHVIRWNKRHTRINRPKAYQNCILINVSLQSVAMTYDICKVLGIRVRNINSQFKVLAIEIEHLLFNFGKFH